MMRRYYVEMFKFGVYLAVPAGAFLYFDDPARVQRFVKQVRPYYSLLGVTFNELHY